MSERSKERKDMPIYIQPEDKGFDIVKKAYNRFIWPFEEWAERQVKKKKKKKN